MLELLDAPETMPHAEWISNVIQKAITDKFKHKNSTYGATDNQYYNFEVLAQRHFPQEYQENKWYAMARIVGVLVDKHQATLAKDPGCDENVDRASDCVIYELFRLRFIMLGNKLCMNNDNTVSTEQQCTVKEYNNGVSSRDGR